MSCITQNFCLLRIEFIRCLHSFFSARVAGVSASAMRAPADRSGAVMGGGGGMWPSNARLEVLSTRLSAPSELIAETYDADHSSFEALPMQSARKYVSIQ